MLLALRSLWEATGQVVTQIAGDGQWPRLWLKRIVKLTGVAANPQIGVGSVITKIDITTEEILMLLLAA